jgi:hypothetical protein
MYTLKLQRLRLSKMKLLRTIMATVLFMLAFAVVSYAGEADVIGVEVKKIGENTYYFTVTVSHNDEGWEHYADKWEIVAPERSGPWHAHSAAPTCRRTAFYPKSFRGGDPRRNY